MQASASYFAGIARIQLKLNVITVVHYYSLHVEFAILLQVALEQKTERVTAPVLGTQHLDKSQNYMFQTIFHTVAHHNVSA